MTSHSDDECPNCGAGGYNEGYCWDCGYDSELGPELIDQLDSELECQKIDMGVYDQVDDEDEIYE